ncbi:MAG: hypothetical protein K2R98_04895 [Gemmataceae bacterium]|nr:hypothetical protein [Gemmataceae bacterium]
MNPSAPSMEPQAVARRIQQFFDIRQLCIDLALEGIRLDHPNADATELLRLLRQRLALGRKGKWGAP